MEIEIKYIELKSGFSDDGPAWIGMVSFSKSRKTIYFNGKAFRSLSGKGINGNFYEVESGDEYWISSVKKNQEDRHVFGRGRIIVEKRILSEYLGIVNKEMLNNSLYIVDEVNETIPILKINKIENEKHEGGVYVDDNKRFLSPKELTFKELEYFIEFYYEDSINGRYLKGRKLSRKYLNELIAEKEFREIKQNL